MIAAIVKNDMVTNLIVISEYPESISEMEAALDCKVYDASVRGLMIGDVLTAEGWTRNAGGEQMLLPLLDAEQYDSYTLAMERALNAESTAADEALAILRGEVVE